MGSIPIVSGLNDHQLGAALVLALIFQVGIVVQLRYNGRHAKAAHENAAQASAQTISTSNGFTGHVLGKLDKLAESSDRLQYSMECVQKTQDEQREQLIFMKEHVQRVDKRQQDHMEYHVNREKNNA